MVNRVAAEGLQARQYFHRFTDDALDLCDVLGSYIPGGKVKLNEVTKILGLSGKPEGIDGSQVEEMVRAGKIEEVARYCESDVLNTFGCGWSMNCSGGRLQTNSFEWSEGQLKEFVGSRKTANCHLCAAVGIAI
jgi:hypothetical protein